MLKCIKRINLIQYKENILYIMYLVLVFFVGKTILPKYIVFDIGRI